MRHFTWSVVSYAIDRFGHLQPRQGLGDRVPSLHRARVFNTGAMLQRNVEIVQLLKFKLRPVLFTERLLVSRERSLLIPYYCLTDFRPHSVTPSDR
jgi:hypothetical protein